MAEAPEALSKNSEPESQEPARRGYDMVRRSRRVIAAAAALVVTAGLAACNTDPNTPAPGASSDSPISVTAKLDCSKIYVYHYGKETDETTVPVLASRAIAVSPTAQARTWGVNVIASALDVRGGHDSSGHDYPPPNPKDTEYTRYYFIESVPANHNDDTVIVDGFGTLPPTPEWSALIAHGEANGITPSERIRIKWSENMPLMPTGGVDLEGTSGRLSATTGPEPYMYGITVYCSDGYNLSSHQSVLPVPNQQIVKSEGPAPVGFPVLGNGVETPTLITQ